MGTSSNGLPILAIEPHPRRSTATRVLGGPGALPSPRPPGVPLRKRCICGSAASRFPLGGHWRAPSSSSNSTRGQQC